MRNHTYECERIYIYIERVSNGSCWGSVCFGRKKVNDIKMKLYAMWMGLISESQHNMFNTLRYSILKSHVDLRLFIFLWCLFQVFTMQILFNIHLIPPFFLFFYIYKPQKRIVCISHHFTSTSTFFFFFLDTLKLL